MMRKGKGKRQVILGTNRFYPKQLLNKAYLAYSEPILTLSLFDGKHYQPLGR